jgi:hypothetical protein
MTQDIIVSRQFSVGPGGLFFHGAGHGPVTVTINFFRPGPSPDQERGSFPAYRCAYEIRYGEDVVRSSYAEGMDGAAALLNAMHDAASDLDRRYFSAIGGCPPYLDAIPSAYLEDMRKAGYP